MPSSLASLVLALSIAGSGVENNSSPRYIPPRFLQVQAHSEHPIDKAMDKYNENDLHTAVQILEDYLKKLPNDKYARETLGGIYFDMDRFDKAAFQFTKLVKLKPKDENAYLQLVGAYIFGKKPKEAGETLDKLLTVNPLHVFANVMRGNLYLAEKERDKAVKHFEKAGKAGAVGLSTVYLNERNLQKAQSVLEDALKKSDGDCSVFCELYIQSSENQIVYAKKATVDEVLKAMLLKINYTLNPNLKVALEEFSKLFPHQQDQKIPADELFYMFTKRGGFRIELKVNVINHKGIPPRIKEKQIPVYVT